jgi:predicted AlkP superfamily phosphohydrolase/phosphomutase
MTGKNPGKHGLYDWIYRHADGYAVSPVDARHCTEPTLWSLLGDAGLRVCVLNVPMTYPPRPVAGVMVSGLPAPSTQAGITYPPQLLAEIEAQVGEYLLYPDPGQAYSDVGVDAFLRRLYRTTETRLKVLAYLQSLEDWDFLMVVFNGTDSIQHAMWKFMSAEHPQHSPAKAERYGSAILHYYQYIDRALEKIVAGLDRDTVLILMSDHGAGPFHKFIYVNNWLRQQGWLRLKRGLRARLKSVAFDLGFTPMNIYNLLMRLGLGSLKREVVRGRGHQILRTLFLSFDDVDWSRTAAYSLGNVGQIYLNVRGREPQGIVEPGPEYERMRDEVIARLQDLLDPETGECVVEEVYRREDVYSGDKVGKAADIVFIPKRMEYFGFGEYEFGSHRIVEPVQRGISGTHRPNGILLLWGEPIRSGVVLEGAHLHDLAPTILHLMNVAAPTEMDGRVLSHGLKPELASLPRQHAASAPSPESPSPSTTLSPEEERLITDRLRGLGYVG